MIVSTASSFQLVTCRYIHMTGRYASGEGGGGAGEERGGGGGNLLTDHLNAKLIRWGCDSNLSTCPVMRHIHTCTVHTRPP